MTYERIYTFALFLIDFLSFKSNIFSSAKIPSQKHVQNNLYWKKYQFYTGISLPHDCCFAAANEKPLLCCGKTTGIFNTDDNIQRILLNNDAQF